MAFFAQTTASFCKNLLVTLVFEKNVFCKLKKMFVICLDSMPQYFMFYLKSSQATAGMATEVPTYINASKPFNQVKTFQSGSKPR
jgi:hypothetical protein